MAITYKPAHRTEGTAIKLAHKTWMAAGKPAMIAEIQRSGGDRTELQKWSRDALATEICVRCVRCYGAQAVEAAFAFGA